MQISMFMKLLLTFRHSNSNIKRTRQILIEKRNSPNDWRNYQIAGQEKVNLSYVYTKWYFRKQSNKFNI